ncbi:MAG: DUF308 domain-containing protein [Rubellimicrobium sp.]|nr:DUF308 domain-containing protein [Rubellimicrobium sp.]
MKGSTLVVIAGTLALVVGIGALLFPLASGLTVTLLVGWGLVFSGGFGLWGAFSDRLLMHRGWVAFFGLVELVLGVWMLANPLAGLISLTLLVGVLLVMSGLGRLMVARRFAGGTFWLLVVAGIASVALGLYALFAPLLTAPVLIGTLLAIELISVGATLLVLGVVLKRRTEL